MCSCAMQAYGIEALWRKKELGELGVAVSQCMTLNKHVRGRMEAQDREGGGCRKKQLREVVHAVGVEITGMKGEHV